MTAIRWDRYPRVARQTHGHVWLQIQANLGLASNTIDAYGRGMDDYLGFCECHEIPAEAATKEHLSWYVRDLTSRPNPRGATVRAIDSGFGLANATLQQRLVAVRLWYDYLIEEGIRTNNPVGRGRYTPGKGFGGARDRALIPRYHRIPWIPNDDQWMAVLQAARGETVRNRVMLAFAYDAGLRREELCGIATADIDPAHRKLHIRAETTKTRRERVVPYSEATGVLFQAYLHDRHHLSRARGPLFLSESDRNLGQPLSIWTWSKVVKRIANRAGIQQFKTHTTRHLCLTDLARNGWDIHEIALFAGHQSLETTLLYIHLSGRELGEKIEKGMAAIHDWRIQMLAEVLT